MLAGAQYFATYTLGSPTAVTPLFACLVSPLVLTMPMWLRTARRVDRRECGFVYRYNLSEDRLNHPVAE
ncbi:hypothetical protein [Nocardiopsis ansamitocini]